MRLLILGAGASCHAGYPLASDLLSAVERFCLEGLLVNAKTAWGHWAVFRDNAPSQLAHVVRNGNPEVVFSLLSLLELAADSEDEARTRAALRAAEQGAGVGVELEELEEYFGGLNREFLSTAKTALAHLAHAIDWYFQDRHIDDQHHWNRRAALRELLKSFSAGDIVISLNWDTLAERILAEYGLWAPATGYGFRRDLQRRVGVNEYRPMTAEEFPSATTVLKLHGSFGWYSASNSIVFENSIYLAGFNFHIGGKPAFIEDAEWATSMYSTDRALILPSFLKRVPAPLLDVWSRASDALRDAGAVDICGYSLPEADSGVRALMIGLRNRLSRNEVRVRVTDPSSATLDRWTEFLGTPTETVKKGLENAP
jgi:hypothetical protein